MARTRLVDQPHRRSRLADRDGRLRVPEQFEIHRRTIHLIGADAFAKTYANQRSGKATDDLLEAVKFFADVPPSEYTKDAGARKLFERYKAIALGDCVDGDQDNSGETTGQPA